MSKLKIFLADLTHNYKETSNRYMPYGVGLIASYAKKIYGDDIEVKLFKYPDKLHKALTEEHCDILGCATYVWNTGLSHWACKVAKKINPDTLTVLGGPNFAKDKNQKIEYLNSHKFVDIRVLLEGEVAFTNIIKLVLKFGIKNRKEIFRNKIEGCCYLHQNKKELVEAYLPRMEFLDEIPSPYTTGILDEFFDGKLGPILQTSRGCPFSCNFCHESEKYYSRIYAFQSQYAIDELEYIGKKMADTKTVANLVIADSNYGMYKRDKLVSQKIVEIQKKYNWPQGIIMSTGKHFGNVIENTEMLMDIFDFTMSVQSMDAGVLEEVKRKNIPPSKYKAAGEYLRKKGRDSLVEIIVPLPKESLKTYFQGMKDLMAWKVSRIVSNTIMFLNGTEFKNKEYIDKFGYKSKFRLIPRQFGIYGGDKVYEIEEVGIATNSMSFEDYLETRKFGFITEMLFNSRILREVELFVDDCKLNYYDFVFLVYKNLENSHPHIKGVMDSFIKQSVSELKDSEELLINYYSEDNNFKKLVSGDEGGNLKYSHKAMLLFKHKDIWLEFVFDCLKKFLLENNVEVDKQFDDIVEFTKCKLEGVMDRSKTNVEVKKSFNFDVVTWVNQEDRAKPLKEFKNGSKIKIKFAYDTNQIRERNVIFDKFKNNDAFDMTNILVSIRPQHKVFRKFALDKA